MAWWSRLRTSLLRRRSPDPIIKLVAGGFDVVAPQDQTIAASVRWAQVTKIQTYKLDLVTTDCICLVFESRDGSPVQISEEWQGFAELFGPISAAFPSISANWYADVMSPAFERNQRVLYDATKSAHRAVV
jgi:hypothetical protein